MKYVDTGSSSGNTSSNGQYGTVTAEGGLRVRSSAGDGDVVGSLKYGTRVEILSETKVGNTNWGEISTGWICLDYVSMD